MADAELLRIFTEFDSFSFVTVSIGLSFGFLEHFLLIYLHVVVKISLNVYISWKT